MRLSPSRIAGISAWTAAAVAWGTAAVAVANPPQPPVTKAEPVPEPAVPIEVTTTVRPAVPTIPSTGLVIVRYTPVPIPEPETISERRVVSTPGAGTPSAPAPAPPAKSGGS